MKIIRGRVREPIRNVNPPLFILGASQDCDLVLGDPRFPQVHSYLLVTSNGVSLRHLGAVPEMTMGKRRVEAVQLLDGDHFSTGPFEFQICIRNVGQRNWSNQQQSVAGPEVFKARRKLTDSAPRSPHINFQGPLSTPTKLPHESL